MYLFPKRNREYIYESGKKVRIGDESDFLYIKDININDEEFMIIESPRKNKYLVPLKYYIPYRFEKGQKIKGWVDQINCSGRIFIEPFHPNYNVNQVYNFDVIRIEASNDAPTERFIVVKDVFGNEVKVKNISFSDNAIPTTIACRVDKIKKGKIYLSIFK
ncbi:MAG TPA: hypothetical protein DEH02_04230 [Bacteroidales bacterium]|nr:MAG: hypothetical protein A2X01_20470 [Bacteroidetes bacterium GWF2_35_48]OFY93675.1 MAG: hypothetical protein A2491_00915 [Bacteroidetes bacterium RIFOXYC12_FULL_35_7]HBX50262.1 hypothetical protein [Bacteroidales bacterium]